MNGDSAVSTMTHRNNDNLSMEWATYFSQDMLIRQEGAFKWLINASDLVRPETDNPSISSLQPSTTLKGRNGPMQWPHKSR